jgi:hypothetical protein
LNCIIAKASEVRCGLCPLKSYEAFPAFHPMTPDRTPIADLLRIRRNYRHERVLVILGHKIEMLPAKDPGRRI